jgi:hypothetical protein
MRKIIFISFLLAALAVYADYIHESSIVLKGNFTDNGDSTPFVFTDKNTEHKFAGVRFVSDANRAEHGRIVLYGQCIDPTYANWNCGAIDFTNLRSHRMDNRIALIRARGYDSRPETSGILDFFTYNAEANHYTIGMHLDGNGRLSVGADNGYPFANHATAWLMLAPGRSSRSGAPLKFNPGALLDKPEIGAIEFDGSSIYVTTAKERRVIVTQSLEETPITSQFWRTLWARATP